MSSNYDFANNNFVIASSTPSINFQDTSNSSLFPTTDWRIKVNDEVWVASSDGILIFKNLASISSLLFLEKSKREIPSS